MAKLDRPAYPLILACTALGLTTWVVASGDRALAEVGIQPPLVAQTVVIDGVSVQTSSGFSFTFTEQRLVPSYPSYSHYPSYPNYPIGHTPFRHRSHSGINRSTLINPTIINSPIRNSTIINPTIVNSPSYPPGYGYNPGYGYHPGYPYSIQTIQTINRPAPEIIVDPQYGVRFKNPPGY